MKKYDLEKLWDEHTRYEFATPDVEATLATMVDDACVNQWKHGQGNPPTRNDA